MPLHDKYTLQTKIKFRNRSPWDEPKHSQIRLSDKSPDKDFLLQSWSSLDEELAEYACGLGYLYKLPSPNVATLRRYPTCK